MNKKVKLEDIANKLQISIVTVSNALAGRSGVGDELKKRIIETADEMGYVRKERRSKKDVMSNQVQSGIKIGVIAEHRFLEKYNSFYWEMYTKIVMEASKKGNFVLLEAVTEQARLTQDLPLMVKQKQIDALIVLGEMETEYLQKINQFLKQPIVLLDFFDTDVPCDAVISNSFNGMYQMTNYLIAAGHTKIGFIGSYMATQSIMDRYQGYSKSLMEHNIVENPKWIIPDRDIKTGISSVILSKDDLPTAFVCNCDLTAELAVKELKKLGYKIPEDISIVGFDDFLVTGEMQKKLTTYAVDMDVMAHYAVKILIKRKKGEMSDKVLRVVDGHLVERESVRKRI